MSNEELQVEYPNIYFSKYSTGSYWRKGAGGRDAEALPRNKPLEFLNEQCGLVNVGVRYFVCTCCGTAQDEDQLVGNVFAGKYCKTCYDKEPQIRKSIAESKKPGFYD
ncbi:hypothetical protein F485_gp063 [Aeromonas phage CC2]|uniref:Uncharacterized protein n=1 Tax=Aeromonas phage CC2 TaxID=1204516 RepID=I6X7N1_9CAUD|nr:hypothetical protein F485_gp063 [Aeromonas phage CC2]AFN39417.1 hypothetical protein CC2_298 [Aeromonas phage CC2]